MNATSRKTLFFIFLALFLIATPMLLLYSQGYRLNLSKTAGQKLLVKTGGLFLKIYPKQSEVYINGKLAEKTDIFFGSSLIENLMPQKYSVEVRKQGYRTWQKTLDIKEKEVTEAKNVVLIPDNPQLEVLTKDLSNYWVSPDGKKIIFYETATDGWSLKLYDVDKNLKSQLIGEDDIDVSGADLLSLEWTQDSNQVNLTAGVKEQEKSYSLNVAKLPPQLKKTEIPALPDNTVASERTDDNIYYLDAAGFVYKKDSSGYVSKINQTPLPPVEEVPFKIWVVNDYVFLRDGDSLYFFNDVSQQFEKIYSGAVTDLKLSPDGRKAVYFTNSEIGVYFLKEKLDEPKKSAGDNLFVARLSEKIRDCFWMDSDYLVFVSGGNVKVAETDDRDKINITDVLKFSAPAVTDNQSPSNIMHWDRNGKFLYLLSDGTLYKAHIE